MSEVVNTITPSCPLTDITFPTPPPADAERIILFDASLYVAVIFS
jgi:hypothetical protein